MRVVRGLHFLIFFLCISQLIQAVEPNYTKFGEWLEDKNASYYTLVGNVTKESTQKDLINAVNSALAIMGKESAFRPATRNRIATTRQELQNAKLLLTTEETVRQAYDSGLRSGQSIAKSLAIQKLQRIYTTKSVEEIEQLIDIVNNQTFTFGKDIITLYDPAYTNLIIALQEKIIDKYFKQTELAKAKSVAEESDKQLKQLLEKIEDTYTKLLTFYPLNLKDDLKKSIGLYRQTISSLPENYFVILFEQLKKDAEKKQEQEKLEKLKTEQEKEKKKERQIIKVEEQQTKQIEVDDNAFIPTLNNLTRSLKNLTIRFAK